MTPQQIETLERPANLKAQGALSAAEFEKQKAIRFGPRSRYFPTMCAYFFTRIRQIRFLLVAAFVILCGNAQAQFTTTTNSDGSLNISGYTGPGGAVAIPSTINGLTVTSIGFQAFFDNSNVTSVTIPSTVTTIGSDAFLDCSLTSVTIPNSVTSIGLGAFNDCYDLTSVTIPNSVTSIGVAAFTACTKLSAINVDSSNPDYVSVGGVLYNQDMTTLVEFPGGLGVTSYTIPNTVTTIGSDAFNDCTSLTSVTIPNGVTSIGAGAFEFCSRLTSVTIPNTVTSIGDDAFEFCPLFSVTIPNSVTSIGDGAFEGCSNLVSVTIPNSVTSIGAGAFEFCYFLTSVTIPNTVTSIGEAAFSSCTNLTSVFFIGNAPTADSTVFGSGKNPTIYYLTGTTGWASTFAGLPTIGISNSKFTWLQNNFTSVQLGQPSIVGDTAEPAGDGIPNFLKYAFNLNPFVDGHAALPQPTVVNGNLILTFTESQSDVIYTIEASTYLLKWSMTGVTTQINGNQVTASYPLPASGSAFMHVVVSPAQ